MIYGVISGELVALFDDDGYADEVKQQRLEVQNTFVVYI